MLAQSAPRAATKNHTQTSPAQHKQKGPASKPGLVNQSKRFNPHPALDLSFSNWLSCPAWKYGLANIPCHSPTSTLLNAF